MAVVILGLLLGMTLTELALAASSVETFVGYADNERPNPADFPSGLCTGNFWNGASGMSSACMFQTFDSGAIMILNNGTTNLIVTGLTATLQPANHGGIVYDWGPLSFTLMPGQDAIFTQSDSMDFDGSDTNFCGFVCNYGPPVVSFNVNGTTVMLQDTGHVLDTGGIDPGTSNDCGFSGCNESQGWQLIGTSTVAEPGTLALFGLGLAGVALKGRRRGS
jgi:hypothetical protein